jgi:glucose-6-phosphate 1-dehydrogenase
MSEVQKINADNYTTLRIIIDKPYGKLLQEKVKLY